MRDYLHLKIATAWLMTFWSASAWAATATFPNDLSSIPAAAVAVALLPFDEAFLEAPR